MGLGSSIINHSMCTYIIPSPSNTCTPFDPGATGELIWVWLPCSLEYHAATHTYGNMHKQETNICLPRLYMQMKIPSETLTLTLSLPHFKSASYASHAPHAGWEKGARPPGLAFQAHQNFQWCCTSPEHFTTNAQDWNQAFCLEPLYLITLEVHKHNSTFLRGTEQAWNEVIDF